ncbi:DUF349 domain-containing protein [uncultured Pseudokineococcus sp.]|uniref:DUF349 domain-containing protein n=1 Tax=uncultured Pseudokineococcus sp. TaxID=1642928 RepID=UPI002638820F|nr:DUF349 domain-containing protein [uncultured Pseudokineococcus sp.]
MSDPADAPRDDEAAVQETGAQSTPAPDAATSDETPPEPTTPATTAWDVAQDMTSREEAPLPADTTPEDSAPDGTTPEDSAPQGAAPEDTAAEDTGARDEAPEDTTPEALPSSGATSEDGVPEDAAPEDAAPEDAVEAATPTEVPAQDAGTSDATAAEGAAARDAVASPSEGDARPAPRPAPRPGPGRPGPRPSPVRPGPAAAADPAVATALGGQPSAEAAPGSPAGSGRGPRSSGRPGGRRREERSGAPEVSAEHAPEDTAQWGRVDEDGVVHVRTADGERVVGSYPDVSADEALAYFGRRFADLLAQVDLVEQRLDVADAPVGELRSALAKVSRALADATAVGDLAALAERVDALGGRVTEREREANIAREQARAGVRAQRVELVEEAEALAEADPAQVQWKASGERLRTLFDEWREQQRAAGTARLPKGEEDELWRRLKHARNRFERHRRHHFAELDARHGEAKTVKEGLIAEAEALSGSTDWGPTSTAYRQLMDRWKVAPRAARKEDDALWARFRAAQDVFFTARDAKDADQLEEEKANLVVKEQVLAEAEALLPVRDVRATTAALREVQDRWDAAGRVPRADLGRLEKRMRAVEQAVRDADSERWRRTNPEARARAEGALGQLQDSISGLEAELEQAKGAGDERAVRRAQEALDARRAWLQQVERAAADFSG